MSVWPGEIASIWSIPLGKEHMGTHNHTRTHACTHTHTCTHTDTYAYTHMHTHTYTPTHTHAHVCAHAHTELGLRLFTYLEISSIWTIVVVN